MLKSATVRQTGEPASRNLPARTAQPEPTANIELTDVPAQLGPQRLLAMQRGAGNRAASSAVQRDVVVQRRDEAVTTALTSRDAGDVKNIKSLAGVTTDEKMELVRILAYQGWVGPMDEYKIQEIWASLPEQELIRRASSEIVLWNHCIDVGAELENLPLIKSLGHSYVQDIRNLAGDYLAMNKDFVEDQLAMFGLPKSDTNPAAATPDQDRQIQAVKEAAAHVADLQAEQERSKKVSVGYNAEYGEHGTTWLPTQYDPFRKPQRADAPPTNFLGTTSLREKVTPYETIDTPYKAATESIKRLLALNPMVYAISREGKSDVTGAFSKMDDASARAQLGGAMRKLIDDIVRTEKLIRSDENFALDLIPIQEQLLAGKKGRHNLQDWSLALTQKVGKEKKADHDFANALGALGLQVAGQLAFALAPVTGGASLAALLAVGVGAAGVKAYTSHEQYENLLTASKTAVTPGSEVVTDASVDDAKVTADADMNALALAVVNAAALGGAAAVRYATANQPPGTTPPGGGPPGGPGGPAGPGGTPPVRKGPIPDQLPRTHAEALTLEEARKGAGSVAMRDLNDTPRLEANYGPGQWVKMQHGHKLPDNFGRQETRGIVTKGPTQGQIDVHWFRNETTGKDVEFKFVIRDPSAGGLYGRQPGFQPPISQVREPPPE